MVLSFVLFCFVGVDLCCYFFLQIHSTLYCESISRLMAWFHGKNNLRWHFFNCGCQSKLNACCTLKFRIQKQKNRIRSFLRGYEKKTEKMTTKHERQMQTINQPTAIGIEMKLNDITRMRKTENIFTHKNRLHNSGSMLSHKSHYALSALNDISFFKWHRGLYVTHAHFSCAIICKYTQRDTGNAIPDSLIFQLNQIHLRSRCFIIFFSFFRSSYYAITTRLFQS